MRFDTKFLTDFPRSGEAPDMLKVVAVLLMVVDHVNTVFLNAELSLWWMGRAVFPLFCLVVALHAERGFNTGRYFKTLLPFAVVSQIPYVWVLWEPIFESQWQNVVLNVIWTLGLGGFVAPWFIKQTRVIQVVLIVLAIMQNLFLSQWLIVEYGLLGVLLPSLFLMLLKEKMMAWPLLLGALLFLNSPDIKEIDVFVFIVMVATWFVMIFLLWLIVSTVSAMRSEKRIIPRYFLHYFYPVHLLVLGFLTLLI